MKKLKIKNWTSYIQNCNNWKLYVEKEEEEEEECFSKEVQILG
jgi:hypothetical protein